MTTITDQKQLEQELKELYAVLYRQVGMSKNMFADQYYKFGIAELRRLPRVFAADQKDDR